LDAVDGDRIRALLASETVLMPGVWDALSVRLVAESGFDVAFLSGYATAGTSLGLPDFGYLTQTDIAEVARRVCAAVPGLAVVVDADTGHGNALNTIRTVELLEAAGAAGIFLEDQVWPKKCGHMAGKRVVPADEWLAKLRAAVDHRDRLFVVARTDARAAVGIDEACERARAARDVGVDAIFVEAPESIEELEAIAAAVPDAVRVANMIEAGKTPLLTPSELHDLGYDLIVSPLTGLFAATKAMIGAYGALKEHGTLRDHLDLVVTFDDFNRVIDLDRHYELEQRYAGDTP
jgi:2-methylisocitrate lyase-like PEP mutase family enzyme